MDEWLSQDGTPEPASSGPPPPHRLPSLESSPQAPVREAYFTTTSRNARPYTPRPRLDTFDSQNLSTLPSVAVSPVDPPAQKADMGSSRDSSMELSRTVPVGEIVMPIGNVDDTDGGTFLSDHSLEHRMRRSLTVGPRPFAKENAMALSSTQQRLSSREVKLERNLDQVRTKLQEAESALSDCQQENERLRGDNERLESRLLSEESSNEKLLDESAQLQTTIKSVTATNSQLLVENENLKVKIAALEGAVEKLKTSSQSTEQRLLKALDDCTRLSGEVGSRETELELKDRGTASLNSQLEKSHETVSNLRVELIEVQSRCKSQTEQTIQLQAELQEQKTKEKSLASNLDKSMAENSVLQTSLAQLTASLESRNQQLALVVLERDELKNRPSTPSAAKKDASVQTEALLDQGFRTASSRMSVVTGSVDRLAVSDSLSERIDRIREASDRAALVRQHQRELSRLLAEHESELKDAEGRLEARLRKQQEQARVEHHAHLQQVQRTLQSENQSQLAALESRHKEEMNKRQADYDRRLESVRESLEEAKCQVRAKQSHCDRETKRREALEEQMLETSRVFDEEKNSLIESFQQEVDGLRMRWREERSSLLTEIQLGCNRVIDEHKHPGNTANKVEVFSEAPRVSPLSRGPSHDEDDWNRTPSTYSLTDLGDSLRETEAYVKSVLGES